MNNCVRVQWQAAALSRLSTGVVRGAHTRKTVALQTRFQKQPNRTGDLLTERESDQQHSLFHLNGLFDELALPQRDTLEDLVNVFVVKRKEYLERGNTKLGLCEIPQDIPNTLLKTSPIPLYIDFETICKNDSFPFIR